MRAPSYTHQFKKDVRRLLKQGKDAVKIKTVMTALVERNRLRSPSAITRWREASGTGGNATSNPIGSSCTS